MLYVCPTPIGNLRDITLRVLDVLGAVAAVACEDTRHTGRLLKHYDLSVPLVSYQEHNERERLGSLLPLLREGKDIALVTDAGMPGVSDPGFVLVRACLDEGLPVTVLPGPSAASTALVASGLPSDRFTFVGFLPRERGKLVAFLEDAGRAGGTLVAFESPRRLRAGLRLLDERWPERLVVVARELTKLHEEVLRGTPAAVLEGLAETVRGEVVLVLAPEGGDAGRTGGAEGASGGRAGGSGPPGREAALHDVVTALLAGGRSTKDVARIVSELSGLPSREAYALALKVKRGPSAS
jgi:16S rRNA (cytidine1402-2'-O)-methyltransferase